VPNQSPDAIPIACCDLVNRGTAYSPSGKIYIQALQGELIALDAQTGKRLWKSKHPDKSNAGPEANGCTSASSFQGRRGPGRGAVRSGDDVVLAESCAGSETGTNIAASPRFQARRRAANRCI
jgi:outer membrane protein assembly factor BamB